MNLKFSRGRPWLASLVALLVVAGSAAFAQAPQRPNIVYIVADDLGWKDVGFHDSDIKTPNLDALAQQGARLEQFYAQPMCTPTRAALMTGRYPFRYGLQTAVILSGHTYGLATDEFLLPQALKDAGYRTAIVGKWHLGHGDRKYWPKQRGFDSQYGPLIGEIDYFTHAQHGVIDWYRDNKRVKEPGYSTTLLGNEAVRVIEASKPSQPLFLYLAFNAPHTPYQAPQAYLDRYRHIADPSRRAYAAAITALDDQVGRVVDALKRKGMRDNTLIVFQSDNGGTRNPMFAGEGDMSKVKIPCDNGPFRDGKGSLYEGGTRVVAFANWPGRIKPGSVDGMMHVTDMLPTLVGLAGGSTARSKPLDGMDVWPTISAGAPSPRTEVVYNVEPFRAGVRQGDWKLIWRSPLPEALELYDIAKDPGETTNLAAANPDKVRHAARTRQHAGRPDGEAAVARHRVRGRARAHAHAARSARRRVDVRRRALTVDCGCSAARARLAAPAIPPPRRARRTDPPAAATAGGRSMRITRPAKWACSPSSTGHPGSAG